ncbi:MAG: hypothetical protein K9H48_20515 [Melioribacteraceae bacterium]|nr:hypothetical protein [Melioribacteraceae bacterium]MCF8396206.1 hypothetical protein [Melioribacteraceae bacterium]
MLDTVLQIGKTFRHSADALRHHRYIYSLSKKEKENVSFYVLPILEDHSFDFKNVQLITDENIIQNLSYLKFKTSDNDGAIKYVFGDIYYGTNNKGKEFGNYRISIDAFKNGSKYCNYSENEILRKFIDSFGENKEQIHKLLHINKSIFLHFDFSGKHWYETDALDEINKIMVENFTEIINEKERKGFVFQKILYRTLCSGDEKNDRQFPSFSNSNKYKSRLFSDNDVKNLFYGINYTEKPTITSYNFLIKRASEKIKIVVLPKDRDNKLTAKDYEDFSSTREDVIKTAYELKENDWLFSSLLNNISESVIAYDVVFVKEGSRIDSDILEISGIEKSFIKMLNDRIDKIRIDFEQKFGKNFFIVNSLMNIFNDETKALKKYQSHLYKTLPRIYAGNYYKDRNLLQATIEKIEYTIRDQEHVMKVPIELKVNQLLQDFRFLTTIQNTSIEGENLMNILESPSYKLGFSLGKMAVPLKFEIKSFEKNYVGNLTRRIASLDDLIKFKTDIEQKLIMHEKTYPDIKDVSLTLTTDVKSFTGIFDKNECAFGFFESYFTFSKKKENNSPEKN